MEQPTLVRTRIRVTAPLIEHGRTQDCFDCPVAQAFNAILREGYHAHAGISVVHIYRSEADLQPVFSSRLPVEVGNWIASFDHLGTAWPMEFPMALPEELVKESQHEHL